MSKLVSIMKYFIVYLFIGLALGSYYPILSSYLEESLTMSGKQIGVIFAVATLTSILFLPIWGMITDKIKSPKKTLFVALLLSSILIFILSLVKTFLIFLIVMAIFMIFRAPVFALYDEILVGACKEKEINYGSMRLAGSLGFAVALFLGMFYTKIYGTQVLFIISSIFFILATLLILFTEDVKYKEKEQLHIKEDLPILFRNKFYIFVTILFSITFGAMDANLAYVGNYIEKFSNTKDYIPWAIFLSTSIEIPILFYTKYIYRKFSMKHILFFINILNVFKFALMFLIPTYQVVLLLAPIHGITFGLGSPIVIQFISDVVKKKVLASAYAFYGTIFALFTAIIQYLTGYIKDLFLSQIHFIFILYIFLYLVNTILIGLLLKGKDYKANTF